MNAYIQIIERLISNIAGATWLEKRFFPFKYNKNPIGQLYDTCMLEVTAKGALGILWIEFQSEKNLLTLPFRLARHSEDGDLIAMSPWSLREASADKDFYVAWKRAQKKSTTLVTAKDKQLGMRSFSGHPAIISIEMHSSGPDALIKVESHETFRIFRTLGMGSAGNIECHFLEHLTKVSQNNLAPKLILTHEYVFTEHRKATFAMQTQHVPSYKSLWKTVTSCLANSRCQAELFAQIDALGRLVADFHLAMTSFGTHHSIDPQPETAEGTQMWKIKLMQQLARHVQSLKLRNIPLETLELVSDTFSILTKQISDIDNIGLRIKTHGDLHLGMIVVHQHQLQIIDFSENQDSAKYVTEEEKLAKQSCIEDVASLILSLNFACYSELKNDDLNLISEIENQFLKAYFSNIREHSNSAQLLPQDNLHIAKILKIYVFQKLIVHRLKLPGADNPMIDWTEKILEKFCNEVQSTQDS